ncbi:MAG: hypothetical protein DRQ88_03225 [Epsilonproteobacteria bacterium]|nr:MAG: hypothetical protein DRQ89_01535 [Campylobacterota bacterium]RLA67331.1 MAG: hypothetical protein DRQ88_03225 [Campylobacterota bacterium]
MDFKSIKNLLEIEGTSNPKLVKGNQIIQFSAKYNPHSKQAWGKFATPRNFALKRYNEFLAGRYCINKALNLGIPLGISKSGGPDWPSDFCGSLTHTNGYVSVIVSKKSFYKSVGYDAETIFDKQLAKKLERFIISSTELKRFDSNYEKSLTLTYSAKESLFKALSPLTGIFYMQIFMHKTGLFQSSLKKLSPHRNFNFCKIKFVKK